MVHTRPAGLYTRYCPGKLRLRIAPAYASAQSVHSGSGCMKRFVGNMYKSVAQSAASHQQFLQPLTQINRQARSLQQKCWQFSTLTATSSHDQRRLCLTPGPAAVVQHRLAVITHGLPFALSKPQKQLKFKWGRTMSGYSVSDLQVEVDALLEGHPAGLQQAEVEELLEQLQEDTEQVVPLALQAKRQLQPKYRLPAIANLSLVLCDDPHIQRLNKQYRGKDEATDVLSFELPDEAPSLQLPVKLLGDLVISLDTASRQAQERG